MSRRSTDPGRRPVTAGSGKASGRMPSRSWPRSEILPMNRCSTGRISKPVAAKPAQKEADRQAMDRFCNDRTTKIQAFVDGLGRSMALPIASGQRVILPSHLRSRSRTCAVNGASGRCSPRQRRHPRGAVAGCTTPIVPTTRPENNAPAQPSGLQAARTRRAEVIPHQEFRRVARRCDKLAETSPS